MAMLELFGSRNPSRDSRFSLVEGDKVFVTLPRQTGTISRGEVSEWFKVLLSKSSVLSKAPRVRIPPSPPQSLRYNTSAQGEVA